MSSPTRLSRGRVAFAVFTIVAGAIGWFASFELLTEYIKTLGDPDYVPNCSVSILVSCGPNMGSWQGSLFGFSNPILGISGFAIPIVVGVFLLAGVTLPRWFWTMYQLGLLAGFVFVCWLQAQSIFVLHTLCPWCMVVWAVMIPLWWITLAWPYGSGEIRTSPRSRPLLEGLASWVWVVVLVNFALLALIAQMQLDWFAEFSRG